VTAIQLGGVSLRRANILSDLISFEEDLEKAEKAIDLDDADFHIDLTQVARQIADTVPQHAPTTYEWNLREEADDTTAQPRLPDSVRLSPTLIPIEDFDTTGHSRLTAFYEKLQKGDAPVRIAVMGDSFVEGDILSSDLREKLQPSACCSPCRRTLPAMKAMWEKSKYRLRSAILPAIFRWAEVPRSVRLKVRYFRSAGAGRAVVLPKP
jgi:hypothetical protein